MAGTILYRDEIERKTLDALEKLIRSYDAGRISRREARLIIRFLGVVLTGMLRTEAAVVFAATEKHVEGRK